MTSGSRREKNKTEKSQNKTTLNDEGIQKIPKETEMIVDSNYDKNMRLPSPHHKSNHQISGTDATTNTSSIISDVF